MPDLATVDLEGVEILEAGVPIHGIGSPPEGDIYTVDDLQAMASAHSELSAAGELQSPAAIGHFPKSSDPAVGWLENVRVEGSKLVADQKDTPRKFADTVKAKGYRTRSVELKRVKSQTLKNDDGTPKVFENVVSRLAWLGARVPAVRTLDDVVALYEAEDLDAPDDDVRVVVMYAAPANGTIVWDPKQSLQAVRNDLQEALNPGGMMGPGTLYVNDVSTDGTALVCRDWDDSDAWVVPFTVDADGTVTAAPSSDWTQAEKTWVATSKAYEEQRAGEITRAADTRTDMPETKYTDEQRRAFSEATGLEADKVTDEMLAKAGVKTETEEPPPTDPPPAERALEDRMETLEEELKTEKTKRFEAERRNVIESALHDGRFEPGERESWEKAYELNPEGTAAAISRLPKNDDIAREYGSSEEAEGETEDEQIDKLYETDAEQRLGIPKGELI